MVSGVLSGTVSVISGGKFANGAVTGAFTYLFNYLKHEAEQQAMELRAKGLRVSVINDGSGKEGYFAVDSDYASTDSASIASEVHNRDYNSCKDYAFCSALKGAYEGFTDDLFNLAAEGFKYKPILKVLSPYIRALSTGQGMMDGLREHEEWKKEIERSNK